MITEDYVSFETAKLLKEKGFDSENISEFGGFYIDYYHNGQDVGIATESMMLNKTLSYWEYLRPTLQMAMKWLREAHDLFIQVTIVPHTTVTIEQNYYVFAVCKNRRNLAFIRSDHPHDCYSTYEEACEAAIKYCLENLI